MLRWTGPAGRPLATATARPTTDRACRRVSGAPSSSGSSANQRTLPPKMRTWSIVCGAPRSRSSGGRSAVSRTSGTRASDASTTEGSRLATAVPEVTTTATGRRDARASPSAKYPADRSSSRTRTVSPGCARVARASGVDLDPGHTMTSVTPASTSASTISRSVSTSVTARRPSRHRAPAASSAA